MGHSGLPSRLHNLIVDDLAIDVGTVNTVIYARGRGIVVHGSSLVAINDADGEVVALGNEALEMLGRTPIGVSVHRPLRDGAVADAGLAARMLAKFIRRARGGRLHVIKHVIIAVPPHLTDVECRAMMESINDAGASKVYVIAQGLAAAIGAGLPIDQPQSVMVVDIGGATTKMTVISMSRIVSSSSVPVGGVHIDQALVEYFRRTHNLAISEKTAERVKMEIGSAGPPEEGRTTQVVGHSVIEESPRMLPIVAEEIFEVVDPIVEQIVSAVQRSLHGLPPDAAADIYQRGITLTGGLSLLKGLTERLGINTGLKVNLAPNPLHAVALGAGKLFDSPLLLRRVVQAPACDS